MQVCNLLFLGFNMLYMYINYTAPWQQQDKLFNKSKSLKWQL